jgi:predicted nucleic acid-binding protein
MSQRIRLNELSNIEKRAIFFDTNIWMYLYCDIANYNHWLTADYSRAFKQILNLKLKIATDIIIMSEFINTYSRIAFSVYNSNNNSSLNFKQYRKTDHYKDTIKNVYNIIKNKILKIAVFENMNYNIDSFQKILNHEDIDIDFNDLHIVNLCKKNDMYLLTNDKDFKNAEIDIISNNNLT